MKDWKKSGAHWGAMVSTFGAVVLLMIAEYEPVSWQCRKLDIGCPDAPSLSEWVTSFAVILGGTGVVYVVTWCLVYALLAALAVISRPLLHTLRIWTLINARAVYKRYFEGNQIGVRSTPYP